MFHHDHSPGVDEGRRPEIGSEILHGVSDEALALMDVLYGYAYWMTRNLDETKDLIVESYLELIRQVRHGLRRLDIPVRLFQIVRILTSERINLRSHNGRNDIAAQNDAVRYVDSTGTNPLSPHSPDVLTTLIRTLPEQLGTLIILSDILDLTYERIAELLSCTIGEVASQLQSARIELRAAFLEYARAHGPSDCALSPFEQFMDLCRGATMGV